MPDPTWQRGDVKLWRGDCLELLPLMEAESVRLLWTDPPYGHSNQDGDLQSARVRDGVRGARTKPCQPITNDGPDEMRRVVDEALRHCTRLMTPDCCCCCCCCGGGGPRPTFAWTATRMDTEGLAFFHAVVWDKSGRGNGMGWRFRRNYEFVMTSHLKGGSLSWTRPDLAVPNIMRVMPVVDRLHPNEKPVDLAGAFVELTTASGDTVLDPFMGSGTTGVACVRTGRKFWGIEIDEGYFEIARERIERAMLDHNGGPLFAPPELGGLFDEGEK